MCFRSTFSSTLINVLVHQADDTLSMVVPQDSIYGDLLDIIPGVATQSGKGINDEDPILVPSEASADDFHSFLAACYPP